MKSSINVRYNVNAPKAERNRATHLNRAALTVYPLGSQFKLPRGSSSLLRADTFTRSRETLSSAVHLNKCNLTVLLHLYPISNEQKSVRNASIRR